MKRKHLFLAVVILAAGGLWFARTAWRTDADQNSKIGVAVKTPDSPNSDPKRTASLPADTGPGSGSNNRPMPGQMLRPPDPARKFMEFTPEQRVEFMRKGSGPGG